MSEVCVNCDGKGTDTRFIKDKINVSIFGEKGTSYSARPIKCQLCRGTGKLTGKRLKAETSRVVSRKAKNREVFLLGWGGWSNLRVFGHYISTSVPIVKETSKYYLVKLNYNHIWYSKETGQQKGVKVSPEKSRVQWRIAPQSLEALKNEQSKSRKNKRLHDDQ